jgi:hypothetical protein
MRTISKTQMAYQEADARRWHKRQRREQDKREGITPAQRHIADALANGRQPPLWAIEKRARELGKIVGIAGTTGNVFSLESYRLQKSLGEATQKEKEARFRLLSKGMQGAC